MLDTWTSNHVSSNTPHHDQSQSVETEQLYDGRDPHEAAEVRRHRRAIKPLEAEALVVVLFIGVAHQVQRAGFARKQRADERAANAIALPFRHNRDRSQLTAAVLMRLHLPDPNNIL